MTNQDNLDPFLTALRDISRAAPDDPATLPRIMQTVRGRRGRARRRLRAALLALLSLPLGASAFALWLGPPAILKTWLAARSTSAEPQKVRAKDLKAERVLPVHSDPMPPPIAAESATANAANQPPLTADPVAIAATTPPPTAAAPTPTPTRVANPARLTSTTHTPQPSAATLYDDAHRLHFTEQNYAAALTAWDLYLSELPTPVLHVEAHYNRAMCLLRLARYEDATRALTPFAAGIYGKYRQREATALIRAIQSKTDP